jgi:hypothetical protein
VFLLIVVAAMASSPLIVLAQATSTFTPTATHTPYPFPTTTPGATMTPGPTATRSIAAGVQAAQAVSAFSWPFTDPSAQIRTELQGAMDVISDTADYIDLTEKSVDIRTNKIPLIIRGHSPIPLMRGTLMLFQDFEWLGILGAWFIIAAIDIVAITATRLIISLWGVIERLISLIKLIPFV